MTNLLGSLGRAAGAVLDLAAAEGRVPAPAGGEGPRRCFPDSAAPDHGCVPGSAAPREGCFPEPHRTRGAPRVGHRR
jgi:hypothetical protein